MADDADGRAGFAVDREGAGMGDARLLDEARWREDNREAIDEYNARVETTGTFGGRFDNI